MPDTRHANKVVIVTGAAQGIGYAIAERFLRDGAKVAISDINDEVGARAEIELRRIGPCRYFHCNVARKLDVHNMVTRAVDEFGAIDVLVNNAGILIGGEFLDITEEDLDKVLSVNLKGAFLVSQAVVRHMVEQIAAGGAPGTVINMSSVNAVFALPTQIPYSISKGGVSQLTKAMAIALAPHGIRVNAIGPGSIMTDMLASITNDKAAMERVLSRTPLGRVGEPSEIASVASFLASADASYITGQTIFADGGRLPLNYTVPVKAKK